MPKFHIDNQGKGAVGYSEKRITFGYNAISVENQLDMLWHDIDNGVIAANTTAPDTWYQMIKKIRDKFPKEEA